MFIVIYVSNAILQPTPTLTHAAISAFMYFSATTEIKEVIYAVLGAQVFCHRTWEFRHDLHS